MADPPVGHAGKSKTVTTKQLDGGGVLNPLGRFFILFILLRFQAFSQVALAIAMQLWLITILAKYAGNVVFVELIMRNDTPRTHCW